MQLKARVALVSAAVMASTALAVIPAGADPVVDRCLEPAGITFSMNVDHTRTVSAQSPSDAYVISLPSPIPSGITYGIHAHVYDGYEGRSADMGAPEALILDFLDASGSVIVSSVQNPELLDGVEEASAFGPRGVRHFRTEAVAVRVRHVADNTGGAAATGLGLVCFSMQAKRVFPDLTTTTSTTVPDSSTTVPDSSTTVPDSSTTVPDSSTTVPDSSTTVPGATSSTTTTSAPTTTVSSGGPTTSTTVPTQVLPEVEIADPADPVDATPTFTG